MARYIAEASQSELAARCQILGWDITRDVIAGIEGQRRTVTDWEVVVLAKALKTSIESLYPKKIDWSKIPFPSAAHLAKRRKVIQKIKRDSRTKPKS